MPLSSLLIKLESNMRKFSSYGPPNTKIHYYVPREELISQVLSQLKGDEPDEGGHYITVWAPRQTGKTSIMQQVFSRLKQDSEFETVILPLQEICDSTDVNRVAEVIARELMKLLMNYKRAPEP